MAVYAIVVYIIIKCSITAVKFKYLAMCLLAMGLLCVMFSLMLFFPDIMQVLMLRNTGCVPRSGPYGFVYSIPYIACVIFIPFALNVVLLIASF